MKVVLLAGLVVGVIALYVWAWSQNTHSSR